MKSGSASKHRSAIALLVILVVSWVLTGILVQKSPCGTFCRCTCLMAKPTGGDCIPYRIDCNAALILLTYVIVAVILYLIGKQLRIID